MAKYASTYVDLMQDWVGKKESDGSHMDIINIYNAHRPLARNYKVKSTDSWCATTVSAAAIKLGFTDIMPTECSCGKLIEKCQKMGIWIENENRTPNPGEWIFYDWDDDGVGDNTGWPEHVGVVEAVAGGMITVIEGNYKNAVGRRPIKVNGKNIRGYAAPKYDKEPVKKPIVVKKTYSGLFPKLPSRGYFMEGDGYKTLVTYTTQIKRLQNFLNWCIGAGLKVDGDYGAKTRDAVIKFQKKYGLVPDGKFGSKSLDKAKTIKK